ncbi:type III secretion system inner membrane ring subunit SctD [Criblamydia sequanensis]|uniref:Type III secretion system protein SctD n=1 Tax=Candidatus Criblamydia sequanensis CRIB-18 TaxID=1437425 RepID=A0A090CXX6_9BACT|nr:type III secretion system inner membrane ring subunit SctD [Criblamydia sequanensis]CDR32951.1 putative type III secretion system protein SctD [Criblamydia sequanensis CRIB-18]
MPKLIAEEGKLKGLTLSLEDGEEWLIGRDPETCQFLIEDPLASRKHLICRKAPQGILVENLSTTNPIEINQEEVAGQKLLHEGDTLKIGSTIFRFYTNDKEAEEASFEEKNDPSKTTEDEPMNHSQEEEPLKDKGEVNTSQVSANKIEESILPEEQQKEITDTPLEESKEHEQSKESEGIEDDSEDHVKRRDTLFDEEENNDELLAEIDFDIQETDRWLLKVIAGPNNGAEFTMQAGRTYSLGTDPATCDIIFHDTSVSRQHAKVQVLENDTLSIEDLKSRNGTLVDGEKIQGKKIFNPNSVVTLGTTSFVIFDREGEMQTIISPLLPSIVRFLQKEEETKPKEEIKKEEPLPPPPPPKPTMTSEELKEKAGTTLTAFILIGILTGLFGLTALGVVTLFKSEPIQVQEVYDPETLLKDALAPFPTVQYYYNKSNGSLLLVGHVLTDNAKKQLNYNLQGLKFIKNLDDSGIIIDEGVWQEINQIIAKNPKWRSVNIQATTPGNFVLSGYLKNRSDMEDLSEYLSANFNYLDLLENRVVVEENLANTVKAMLQNRGFKTLKTELVNGELTIKGSIPISQKGDYREVLEELKTISGIHQIQDLATDVEPEKSMIDITDRYEVSGISRRGSTLSVVVDGKIVTKGDFLDAMKITEITPQAVFLERDGVKYRINLK